MLTISVKNFGPIAEGSVDLKPLTIFVGPSNTGKSYMATAVYAVMRAKLGIGATGWIHNDLDRHSVMRLTALSLLGGSQGFTEVVQSLDNWIVQRTRAVADSSQQLLSNLPRSVSVWLEEATTERLSLYQNSTFEELQHIHGHWSNFTNKASQSDDCSLTISRKTPFLNLTIPLAEVQQIRPSFDISQAAIPSQIVAFPIRPQGLPEDGFRQLEVSFGLINAALRFIFSDSARQTYYLPAARSSIVLNRRVLASSLIREIPKIGLGQDNIPTLPGLTTELLSNLISMGPDSKSPTTDVASNNGTSFIEEKVLLGQIDIDESAGLPFPDIAYKSASGKFTIEHTSSMVSELAPLVLFLKYLVRSGDLLILEEPESHLHPAAQRQLARGIVRLVNAGVKVLITTHSDIFVSQINNLLRASYASKRWLREHGYAPEDCIRHDDVSAYLFRMDDEVGGGRTERLEIQQDIGIDDPMFNQVIHELYEESLLVERIRPK